MEKLWQRYLDNPAEGMTSEEVLAMIENPASYQDVVKLKKSLAFLDSILEIVQRDFYSVPDF